MAHRNHSQFKFQYVLEALDLPAVRVQVNLGISNNGDIVLLFDTCRVLTITADGFLELHDIEHNGVGLPYGVDHRIASINERGNTR